VQTAAIAMAGAMSVDALARIPLSFPTYSGKERADGHDNAE
jgi:hypothetical protein